MFRLRKNMCMCTTIQNIELTSLLAVGAKRVFLQLNCCKNLYIYNIIKVREREHENNSQHQSKYSDTMKTY